MTRINAGIAVDRLSDEHLLAEHREIKRLPRAFIKAISSGSIERIPADFCLGKGHVIFFVDKPRYTLARYWDIYYECKRREFNVTNYSDSWGVYGDYDFVDYIDYAPSERDKQLVIRRIKDNIVRSKKETYHYYKAKLNKTEVIELLERE